MQATPRPGLFGQNPPFLFKTAFPGKAQECHTGGILEPHYASMDDIFLCPDCRSEHSEPHEAALGHIARCVSCVMLLDVLAEEQAFYDQIIEIRVAA
jgi:hypothetical protein